MTQTDIDFTAPARTTPRPNKRAKVTFSRMESIGNIPGDDGEQDIICDGQTIGSIRRVMGEYGGAGPKEYRVASYDVEFFWLPQAADDKLGGFDREFRVSRRRVIGVPVGFKTAREAHTAAKNYARRTIKRQAGQRIHEDLC